MADDAKRRSTRERANVSYVVDFYDEEDGKDLDAMLGSPGAAGKRSSKHARKGEADDKLGEDDGGEPGGGDRPKKRGTVNTGKGVRIQGGRVYDSENGTSCHWCRQKTMADHVACTQPRCSKAFCGRCLVNRHGESLRQATLSGAWVCPPCRGSCGPGCALCCNCSYCRKKHKLDVTGQTKNKVEAAGFNNAHDYLVHLATGEGAAAIAARKQQHAWGAWLSVKVPAAAEQAPEAGGGGTTGSQDSAVGSGRPQVAGGTSFALDCHWQQDDEEEQGGEEQGAWAMDEELMVRCPPGSHATEEEEEGAEGAQQKQLSR